MSKFKDNIILVFFSIDIHNASDNILLWKNWLYPVTKSVLSSQSHTVVQLRLCNFLSWSSVAWYQRRKQPYCLHVDTAGAVDMCRIYVCLLSRSDNVPYPEGI